MGFAEQYSRVVSSIAIRTIVWEKSLASTIQYRGQCINGNKSKPTNKHPCKEPHKVRLVTT